jgi:hypothetical protein
MRAVAIVVVLAAACPDAGAENLPYWRDGELVAVDVAVAASPDPLRSRLQAMLYPDGELAVERMLPSPGRIVAVERAAPALVVRLELPRAFLTGGAIDDELLERLSTQLQLGLEPWPELRELHLVARPLESPEASFRSLSAYLPAFDRASLLKDRDTIGLSAAPLVRRERDHGKAGGAPTPALSGKQMFMSQAHGFIDYDSGAAWSTQRGITHGIVEDFVNAEAVNQYLLQYLRNAGAQLFTLREFDRNPQLRIVDNADGAAFPANGSYLESGAPGAFANSGLQGFHNFQAPYAPTDDPFRSGGSDRLLTTSASETARATWTPVIPAAGDYDVYVSYTRNGTQRASDAHYIVNHSGGSTHLRVNQERHGWVWVHLGRFHFESGADPARGSVVLANDSAEVGQTVSADAVRFGGGMGDIQGEFHGTLSGRPRWEEGARYYTQYQGASSSVYAGGDVSARSKFAAWENYEGQEDSLYLSWHSNAFNGAARGTNSYIYSANPPDGSYDPNQSSPGSAALAAAVHNEMIADIRAAWDPAWQDRGLRSAYFGEINPAYNNEMPSVLLEVAFHDNVDDATALAHPRFRQLLARAIYQGIVKYFAQRDAIAAKLLPEPPQAVAVQVTGATSALVSWEAPPSGGVYGDPATCYRVYRSTNGRGFDEGTETTATSLVLDDLVAGQLNYLQVSACNDGGESLPSETLVVRTSTLPLRRVLLVEGFDRLDRSQLIVENDADLGGLVDRMFLERMNPRDDLVYYGEALAAIGVPLESAANEAIANGRIALNTAAHSAVLWELGEESTLDETFSAAEQARVTSYLANGGRLLVAGAEIGWDLDWLGSGTDRAFYNDELGADYVNDDGSATNIVHGASAGIFAGLAGIGFETGAGLRYGVDYPDSIAPLANGIVALHYTGAAFNAAVQTDNGTWRSLNFGFPVAAISDGAQRAEVLRRALIFFGADGLEALFADGFE